MKRAIDLVREQNREFFKTLESPKVATSRIINASDIVEPLLEEFARERDNTVRVDNVSNITKPIVDALDNNNKRIDNLVRQIQTEDEKRSEGILDKLQGAVRGLISTETDKVRNEYREQVKELQKQNKILIDGLKRIEKNTKVKGDIKNVIDTKEIAKEIEKMGDRLEKATREKTTILPPLNMDMFADSVGNRRTALISSDGKMQVEVLNLSEVAIESDPLIAYKTTDLDTANATKYVGYTDVDGNWFIKKITATEIRFIKGTSNYTTNWTNRSSLTYDYFYNIF